MKPITFLLACITVVSLPTPLFACGGCTDAVLLMTVPWAGFGILLLWVWIFVMSAVRWRPREYGTSSEPPIVRGSTLAVFAVLGSAGYIGLAFLTMGSLLLPSLFVGLLWAVYVIVRIVVDAARLLSKRASCSRTPLLIHGAFLVAAVVTIAYWQVKASTLEHCIGCLAYGRHVQLFSRIMPKIVADGQKAVGPLIRATDEAVKNGDGYARANTARNATFCMACIGGSVVEKYLSKLLKQHATPNDYYDLRWYKGACFAYARCAGLRAADDLVTLFEKAPHTAERDDRAYLLVALAVTGSKKGVAFALDHMDHLLRRLEGGGDGSELQVFQATAESLLFGTDSKALTKIPVYRDCELMGATWVAEPRPGDYTSEFFWTESSTNRLRPKEEIEAKWKKDSASVKKHWAQCLK